jgi:hypothetical protein
MAVTQLRCEPGAQALYAHARARGHTTKEACRILERHLSDGIHRRILRDQPLLPSRPRAVRAPSRRTTLTEPGPRATVETGVA